MMVKVEILEHVIDLLKAVNLLILDALLDQIRLLLLDGLLHQLQDSVPVHPNIALYHHLPRLAAVLQSAEKGLGLHLPISKVANKPISQLLDLRRVILRHPAHVIVDYLEEIVGLLLDVRGAHATMFEAILE